MGIFVKTIEPLAVGHALMLTFAPPGLRAVQARGHGGVGQPGARRTATTRTPGWACASSTCARKIASAWSRSSARSRTSANPVRPAVARPRSASDHADAHEAQRVAPARGAPARSRDRGLTHALQRRGFGDARRPRREHLVVLVGVAAGNRDGASPSGTAQRGYSQLRSAPSTACARSVRRERFERPPRAPPAAMARRAPPAPRRRDPSSTPRASAIPALRQQTPEHGAGVVQSS